MAGYSPKLPIISDPEDGFRLTKTLPEMAKQNLKMLVFTNPGERMMDPKFGVGIKSYLFENNNQITYGKIESKITDQVRTYLPYINIEKISFSAGTVDASIAENFIGIRIEYSIENLGLFDLLEISLN